MSARESVTHNNPQGMQLHGLSGKAASLVICAAPCKNELHPSLEFGGIEGEQMPTTTFDLKDLPPRFAEAITSATATSDLIIVDNEVPVARIVLCPSGQGRIAGLHAGTIATSDDFDAPLSDEFWTGTP